MADSFQDRWRERFGLPPENWRSAANLHLKNLPFSNPTDTWPLIRDLFTAVPTLLRRRSDAESALIAEAFAWCCFSFWQCGSQFPSFPENYAGFLRDQLFRAKRSADAVLLARQLVEMNSGGDRCGFNKLAMADPERVRESERLVSDGSYEFYLNAKTKYEEYVGYLRDSQDFQAEWKSLKRAFPTETSQERIIRRSLIPERNWIRGPGAEFRTRRQRFQALFDFFCWKYFLWGMRGDEPLLMKPSVVYTPLGTQIFIPGYLSFDPKRDLDFKVISRLHRARGMSRQGPGFSVGRLSRIELASKARAADRVARQKGLRGDHRYEFIARTVGFTHNGEFRSIRRLLRRQTVQTQR